MLVSLFGGGEGEILRKVTIDEAVKHLRYEVELQCSRSRDGSPPDSLDFQFVFWPASTDLPSNQ